MFGFDCLLVSRSVHVVMLGRTQPAESVYDVLSAFRQIFFVTELCVCVMVTEREHDQAPLPANELLQKHGFTSTA